MCPTSSKHRNQWKAKNVPWLLNQHAGHVGTPYHYHSPQSPTFYIPWRWNSSRNYLLNCKVKKLNWLWKKKKKKKNLEVWALLNTKNRVCSSVVNKSKMPLEQHARRWSVHLPGGTILLMRFSDLMSTILLKTKAPIFLNKMHSCGEDRKDLPAHPSVSH